MDIKFYNTKYNRFTPGHGFWREKIIESRIKTISKNLPLLVAGQKLLDIGCDEGVLIKKIEEKFKVTGFGIEINSNSVLASNHPRITQGAAEELKFTDNFFDICTASHVIEHLQELELFINEVCRVLKIGGYLVLIYPWELFPGMTVIPDLIKSRQPLKLIKKIHPYCYTPLILIKRFKDFPLKPIKSKIFLGFPYIVPQYLSIFQKI